MISAGSERPGARQISNTDLESVLNDLLEGHPIRERENVTQGFEPMLKQW
jgi:hypothetical protein